MIIYLELFVGIIALFDFIYSKLYNEVTENTYIFLITVYNGV